MTAEQKARDILERMGVEGAQNFSAGELVELANLIAGRSRPAGNDADATVSVEASIHAEMKALAQRVYAEHGVRILSAGFDWLDIRTNDGERRSMVTGVELSTRTDDGC